MAADLINRGLLIVPEDEAGWFKDVQQAHDDWAANAAGHKDDPELEISNKMVEAAERKFLELLK